MSPERKAAIAAALGVTTIAALGTATAAAPAPSAKLTLGALLVKWLAAGAVGGAVVIGAAASSHHVRETRSLEVAARRSSSLRAGASRAADHGSTSARRGSARGRPEPVSPSPSAPAPSAHVLSPPAPSRGAGPSSLVQEQRTIERARALLAAGDVAGANGALDLHDRSFPEGAFTEESRVLRIDALARGGERARARSAARAFLAESPSSPYAARLRELAGGAP